jgi:hypothetical protein
MAHLGLPDVFVYVAPIVRVTIWALWLGPKTGAFPKFPL